MFRNISKIKASTLKYTSSFFSQKLEQVTPESLKSCLKSIELGLDALFDDKILDAEDKFMAVINEKNQSPFHAYGYALFIYMKAMLSFEKSNIEEALAFLETIIKKSARKSQKQDSNNDDELSLHYELLSANYIFMSATLQFLNDTSWVDNVKAAYDLRRAIKLYEKLFYVIEGVALENYTTTSSGSSSTSGQKKKPGGRRVVSLTTTFDEKPKTRIFSDNTLKHGVYFGIGLFNVVFLLLPMKVKKVLTGLGFYSSQSKAISLLQHSCTSQTMYASLSSLLILFFFTSISMYIRPQINTILIYDDMVLILDRMKAKYPNGKVWKLIEGKFKRLAGAVDDSIQSYNEAKNPTDQPMFCNAVVDKHGNIRTSSTADFTHFRALVIYEIGWSHIYSGNYYEASESFFCLESLCSWSRIFYHYVATCCLIANQEFDKAVLEVKQIISMIEHKRKINAKLSVNDQYAQDKIMSWVHCSDTHAISLKSLLESITNPIWELVYLWNGTCYWNHDMATYIKDTILNQWCGKERHDEPILCLIMGVIHRDALENIEAAMEYFNLILLPKETQFQCDNWILPYAMYEIAATHASMLKKKTAEYMVVITEWVKCIEYYYLENPQDKEWDIRMQLKCQLLLASCSTNE